MEKSQINQVVKEMEKMGVKEWGGYVKVMLECKASKWSLKKRGQIATMMAHTNECIVGEAHGWNSCYGCGTCDHYAMTFDDIMNDSAYEHSEENGTDYMLKKDMDKQELFRSLMAFLGHWQEEHAAKKKVE